MTDLGRRFSYRRSADGLLFINWDGRKVRVLRGLEATRVMYELRDADPGRAQLLLAHYARNTQGSLPAGTGAP